jgi:hypothetical protein
MEFQMKVFVYFNLHKKCWSVKALEGPRKGRVVQHAKTVALHNVTFKVSEAGRQRVLREKKKNVHAGAVGTLDVYSYETSSVDGLTKVSYNPYKAGHFVNKETNEPVHTAQYAYLIDKSVMVK